MSELASLLAQAQNPKHGPRCTVDVLLEQIRATDPAGAAALVEAIDNHALAATVISDALIVAGHTGVKVDSIRRHRKRGTGAGCSCP